MTTAVDDAIFWRLSGSQAAQYHARLAQHHANQAARYAARAKSEARRSRIGSRVALASAIVATLLSAAEPLWRWLS